MKKFSMMIALTLTLACSKGLQSTTPVNRGPVMTDSVTSFTELSSGESNSIGGAGEQTPTDPIITATPTEGKKQERLVIHNASLIIAVKEVQSAIQKTEEIAKKYQGLVVSILTQMAAPSPFGYLTQS
jgi:hypothetical protein